MSLRRRFIETLAEFLRVPLSPAETSLTIVVENQGQGDLDATAEPIASGAILPPGGRCTFRAFGSDPSPEIHINVKEGLICIWGESDMSQELEVDYEELKRSQEPAA